MNGRSQRQFQTSVIRDAVDDKPLSADSAPREDRNDDLPFFHADCCLVFLPANPVDFHAFAKGQLMAMVIFVPAAIALFMFFAS